MAYIGSKEYYLEVAKGNVSGTSVVDKFGRNPAVGTGYGPVSIGSVYQTPQPAAATTLRIKAGGDVADTAAGAGARQITLNGLDASGNEQTVTIATNGATASTATTETWIRLFRAYVSESGTYATQSTGSHVGDIVIENGAGGTDWLTIDSTGFPRSQSEVGAYTIPAGKTGYLLGATISTDSGKTTDIIFFKRESVLDAAAPYDGMRVVFEEQIGAGAAAKVEPSVPIDGLAGPCDVGFLAKVDTGTASIEVGFQLLIVDN